MTHTTPLWPTPALHDPPHSFITHPTPSWTNHPFMTYPSPTGPNSLLHDPPHPFMNHPTPPFHDPHLHDPPHLFMTHPTPTWPTPPHFMTHPTPPLHDPSDEPPPAWSPSSPSGHGGRVWSKQPGGGTGQNWGGTYMQIFGYFGYLCGLKWVKICWQIDTKENCLDGLFWVRVTRKMLNVNWGKIHSIILSVTCDGLRNFSLLIHIPSKPYMTHPTPPLYDTPHPTPTWPTPTLTLHDPPTPPQPCMTHPTPPLHGPPYPWPTPTWPTPPHPCMTHPTPPLHDPPYPTPPHPCMTHPTPPHPCMTHPTRHLHDPPYPTPPHPTPEQFWEEMGWISWGPSLCLPFGRQKSYSYVQNNKVNNGKIAHPISLNTWRQYE